MRLLELSSPATLAHRAHAHAAQAAHGSLGANSALWRVVFDRVATWPRDLEVCTNQTPLCYIIGYNILRYQALPWHISYQETV